MTKISRKESKLWDALNNTTDIFTAMDICDAFELKQEKRDEVMSLWESKRTLARTHKVVY